MGVPNPQTDPQFYQGVVLRRFMAFLIDFVIILMMLAVVAVIGVVMTALTFGLGAPLAFIAGALTGFAYRWMMLTHRSATLGMLMTGIEVRDAEGHKMTQSTAFLHTIGFHATFLFPPLAFIGWLLLATSPYRRAMHDIFIGSVVINRPT